MLLAAAALIALRPWEPDALAPQLQASPALEIGLDDSVAVASDASPAVATAEVVVERPTAVARPVALREPLANEGIGIAPAQPVQRAQPVSAPAPIPAPAPVTTAPVPVAAPAPIPATVPVSAPAPPSPPRAVAGGGVDEEGEEGGEPTAIAICEGDEYVVIAVFDPTAFLGEEEVIVDVLVRHAEGDEGESEILLEGLSPEEARELVDLLVSAGACAPVEVEPVLPF